MAAPLSGSTANAIRYNWKTAAELAHEAVQRWMENPLHHRNLMSPIYRSGGLSIAFGRNSTIFVTCNFSVVDRATLATN
ncbi:MAG: CAP domain-containing protein [Bacteroidota bacterium]|nr:CAP domain-containing protein [Bacteroidota bacterium]MDE2833280.1 CAP domain-containing protein [Bacteroidota bacterium]